MNFAALKSSAQACQLDIFGVLSQDEASVVLLGPHEPGFWANFTQSPEANDGLPDPIDRWSKVTITALAQDWGGTAFFPSDGPPFPPFFQWALDSGSAWQSPVSLLVHQRAGLWASYRGAIKLPTTIAAPIAPASPCTSCAAPCLTACPVGALAGDGYDLEACHRHLDTAAGDDCMRNGCAVRRICPTSQTYGRLAAQSAFHMKAFHP